MTSVDGEEMPILGEPLPVEFANTLYVSGDTIIDFLGTPELIHTWFALAAPSVALPSHLRRADADAIRDLRAVINRILGDLIAGRLPHVDDSAALNDTSTRAPMFVRLDWSDPTQPKATTQHDGTAIDAMLGRIATETIALVAGQDRVLLRRCDGPDCAMLFVRTHHKRQWCHESCGHRARQARYYRRTLQRRAGLPMVEGTTSFG